MQRRSQILQLSVGQSIFSEVNIKTGDVSADRLQNTAEVLSSVSYIYILLITQSLFSSSFKDIALYKDITLHFAE